MIYSLAKATKEGKQLYRNEAQTAKNKSKSLCFQTTISFKPPPLLPKISQLQTKIHYAQQHAQ